MRSWQWDRSEKKKRETRANSKKGWNLGMKGDISSLNGHHYHLHRNMNTSSSSSPHYNDTSFGSHIHADPGTITALVMFGLLLIATFIAALRHWMMRSGREGAPRFTISGIFYLLATIFVGVRLAWLILLLLGSRESFLEFTLNCVADLFFFSCFSLIVLYTFENFNKTTVGDAKRLNSKASWVFFVINLTAYAIQAGILAYINVALDTADIRLIIVSLMVTVIQNLLCGLGFLAFSFRMYISQKGNNASISGLKKQLRSAMVVSLIMTLCFAARAVLYILQVAGDRTDIRRILFVEGTPRLLFICASEIIPIGYQLFAQRAKKKQEQHIETFIQNLYDESREGSSEGDSLILTQDKTGVN